MPDRESPMPVSKRRRSGSSTRVPTPLVRRLVLALGVAALCAVWLATLNAQGTWATETSLPSAIQEVSVTSLNGLVYVVGGSVNQVRSNATQVFTPSTHTWATAA